MVRGVIHEFDETQLGGAKQTLKFRRVDYITLQVVQADLPPNIVLELVVILEWIVVQSHN